MTSRPLDLHPVELRLLTEYRQVRNRAPSVEPAVQPEVEDVDLGDPAALLPVRRMPSGIECLDLWRCRYPTLSSTDELVSRIEPLRQQLLAAISTLPAPPEGRVCSQVIESQAERVREVGRAVSLFARYLHAVAALRSLVSHCSGQADPHPVDPYEVGRSVLYDPAYFRYDRWRVRVCRLRPEVQSKNRAYDRTREETPERRAYKREYMRRYMRARRAERKGAGHA